MQQQLDSSSPTQGRQQQQTSWAPVAASETPAATAAATEAATAGVDAASAALTEEPPAPRKICVLLSSEKHLHLYSDAGGTPEYTAEAGASISSLLSIYRAAKSCAYTLGFVTPSGGPPAVASTNSLEETHLLLAQASSAAAADELLQQLRQPQQLRKVAAADAAEYSCLLLPHHLGAAADIYKSHYTPALIQAFLHAGKPVGAIGYGAFALCAKRIAGAEGQSPRPHAFSLAGRCISTVSLAEEARHPYFGLLPLHLEIHLSAEGARVCTGGEGGAVGLVVDRGVVTAANEESTELLTRTLIIMSTMQQQQQ
ncbi:hypothetical protein ACSSS7_005293 [Eimeria intestinalis]